MPYSEYVNVLPGYVTAVERQGTHCKAQRRHGHESWKRLLRSSPACLPAGLSPSLASAVEASGDRSVAFSQGGNSEGPTGLPFSFCFIAYPFPTLPLAGSYDGLESASFSQRWLAP